MATFIACPVLIMSSRALRRLQQEAAVIRVVGGVESSSGEEERPGFSIRKTKKKVESCDNPFAVVSCVTRLNIHIELEFYLSPTASSVACKF